MIKPKGRPATQCTHCRESRKSKQLHTKCKCSGGPLGKHSSTCPCHIDKELCTCSKNKQPRRPASNPPPTSRLSLTPTTATVATTAAATVSGQPAAPAPCGSSVSRSSSTTSLASSASRSRHRKSTIMNSRGPILHPSSSASLSTKLSLMSSNHHLTDPEEDDPLSTSSLPMLLPFPPASTADDYSNSAANDLLDPFESSYKNHQLIFPSSSATSLSTMMQDQFGGTGSDSFSSFGNFMTSSSNMDGYASDAEPPLQINYPRYQPSTRQPSKSNSAKPPSVSLPSSSRGVGEVILSTDDSVLDDFTLLSPDDNFELLNHGGGSTFGLLERVDDKSDFSDDPSQSMSRRSSEQLISPASATASSISAGNSEINLFATHQQHQQQQHQQDQAGFIKHQRAAANHPLYPILAANRPPHKDLDYASYLAQSRANKDPSAAAALAPRKSSASSTPSSASPSSVSTQSMQKQSDSSSEHGDNQFNTGSGSTSSTHVNGLFATPHTHTQLEQLQQEQPDLQIKDVFPSPFVEMMDITNGAGLAVSKDDLSDGDSGSASGGAVAANGSATAPVTNGGHGEFGLPTEFNPLFMQDDFFGFDNDFQASAYAAGFGGSSGTASNSAGPSAATTATGSSHGYGKVGSPGDSNMFGSNHFIL